MKKLTSLIALVALITLTSFISLSSAEGKPNETKSIESTSVACTHGQCTAIAASTGKTCKHCVSNEGDLYCWQHK